MEWISENPKYATTAAAAATGGLGIFIIVVLIICIICSIISMIASTFLPTLYPDPWCKCIKPGYVPGIPDTSVSSETFENIRRQHEEGFSNVNVRQKLYKPYY